MLRCRVPGPQPSPTPGPHNSGPSEVPPGQCRPSRTVSLCWGRPRWPLVWLRGKRYCQKPQAGLSPVRPSPGCPQTLTKYLEPHGGLSSDSCSHCHHTHVVPLIAHLDLSQHQAPLGVQLVWGAAAPGAVHPALDLGAPEFTRSQTVADPGAVSLWAGSASARGCLAAPLRVSCLCCSVGPSPSPPPSSLSGPSVPLPTPFPPLLSHLLISLFFHFALFLFLSHYLCRPLPPCLTQLLIFSPLFLSLVPPPSLAFLVSVSECPFSRGLRG